jgi:hypothetical protein
VRSFLLTEAITVGDYSPDSTETDSEKDDVVSISKSTVVDAELSDILVISAKRHTVKYCAFYR